MWSASMPSEPSQPAKSISLSKCKAFNLETFEISWEARAPFLNGEFERITECRNRQFLHFLDKGVNVKPHQRGLSVPKNVKLINQLVCR